MKYSRSTKLHVKGWKKILLGECVFWALLLLSFIAIDYSVDSSNGELFSFRRPQMLLFLVGILPIHLFFLKKYNRIHALMNGVAGATYGKINTNYALLKHMFFTRILVFVLLSMAQPSIGKEKVEGTIKSLELVICLDVSNSMNVMDMDGSESRLTASKRAMNDLINHLTGEKIGVCVFAGSSFVQLPLTSDYDAAKLFIEDVTTTLISQQGTNISSAIETAEEMFSPVKGGKAILLITDGEDHDGNALEKVRSLEDQKIELHVLGVGSATGGPLLKDGERPELGFRTSEKEPYCYPR